MKRSLVVSLIVASLIGCDHADPHERSSPDAAPALEVVPVVESQLSTTARLPAELTSYQSVALYPRVSGFVDAMLVDRGSKVRKGQVLARLSAPELLAQRTEAESKLAATRSTAERLRAAASTPGVVAKHDLEVADAAAHADESRVRSLKDLEAYLLVRAPFDGVITERNLHPGALVGPPSGSAPVPMLRMEEVRRLRLTVPVPETDVGAIADGAKAEFIVRAYPGEHFHGVIRRVAHALDLRTRTMPVELDVDNADTRLASGMFAEVLWPVQRERPSLFVPPSAIVQTTQKTYVDRVRDGVVEQVTVQRGAILSDKVEVFGELHARDLVLRRGSEELKPGTHVSTSETKAH